MLEACDFNKELTKTKKLNQWTWKYQRKFGKRVWIV